MSETLIKGQGIYTDTYTASFLEFSRLGWHSIPEHVSVSLKVKKLKQVPADRPKARIWASHSKESVIQESDAILEIGVGKICAIDVT